MLQFNFSIFTHVDENQVKLQMQIPVLHDFHQHIGESGVLPQPNGTGARVGDGCGGTCLLVPGHHSSQSTQGPQLCRPGRNRTARGLSTAPCSTKAKANSQPRTWPTPSNRQREVLPFQNPSKESPEREDPQTLSQRLNAAICHACKLGKAHSNVSKPRGWILGLTRAPATGPSSSVVSG